MDTDIHAVQRRPTVATIRELQLNEMSSRRRLGYTILALLLVLYMAGWVACVIAYDPPIFYFSHYSVDYTLGFVRRGLGGEILDLFPADLYFTVQWTLRWLVSTVFIIGLAAVAWKVALRFGRSERRLMLALLIPVLPFGFARAVFLPLPERACPESRGFSVTVHGEF